MPLAYCPRCGSCPNLTRLVDWLNAPVTLGPVAQELSRVLVFCMDHAERNLSAGHVRRLHDLVIRQTHGLVGHEHLDAGHASGNQRRQILFKLGATDALCDLRTGNIHEAMHFRHGDLHGDRAPLALAVFGQAEGHIRRVCAADCRLNCRSTVVRHLALLKGWLQDKRMTFNALGHCDKTLCADDFAAVKPGFERCRASLRRTGAAVGRAR
ncbi:MAG: hypothetical protein AAF636_23260 [Pseudomonadota bacterium]